MGKLHKTVLVLGEGPTEFYYFNSLRDLFCNITISPDYPRHTNLKDLEQKISAGLNSGYDYIFCVIDMDTKDNEPECSLYQKLKAKFAKPIVKPKKGINCKVEFFETHRCTELFFLYYFRYTSRNYENQDSLIEDLNKSVEYSKTKDFFNKCRGLHNYFEKNCGSLDAAIENAEHSIVEMQETERDYTYSELGRLIKKLREISMSS